MNYKNYNLNWNRELSIFAEGLNTIKFFNNVINTERANFVLKTTCIWFKEVP